MYPSLVFFSFRSRLTLFLATVSLSIGLTAQVIYTGSSRISDTGFSINAGWLSDQRMQLDSQGNVYLIRYIADTVDLDNGPETILEYPLGALDALYCLVKYDAVGNYLWHVPIPCINIQSYFYLHGLAVDEEAGLLAVVGEFNGRIDVDPGPSGPSQQYNSSRGIIAVYDLDGGFIRSHIIGQGTGSCELTAIEFDADHDLIVGGYVFLTVDIDPVGTFNITGNNEPFLAKYDSSGALVWAHVYDGASGGISGVQKLEDGGLLVTGTLKATEVDVDLGPGTQMFATPVNRRCGFVSRYVPGTPYSFAWMQMTGGTFDDCTVSHAQIGPDGSVLTMGGYVSGATNSALDLDPGPGVNRVLPRPGTSEYKYVVMYNADGTYRWGVNICEERRGLYFGGIYHAGDRVVVGGTVQIHSETLVAVDRLPILTHAECNIANNGSYPYLFTFDGATGELLHSQLTADSCDFGFTSLWDMKGRADGQLVVTGEYLVPLDMSFGQADDPLPGERGAYLSTYDLNLLPTTLAPPPVRTAELPFSGSVRVLDLRGRTLIQGQANEATNGWSTYLRERGLCPGVYLVTGNNGTGSLRTDKVLVTE